MSIIETVGKAADRSSFLSYAGRLLFTGRVGRGSMGPSASKALMVSLIPVFLISCGLPQLGPNQSEIRSMGDDPQSTFEIVEVTAATMPAQPVSRQFVLPSWLQTTRPYNQDVIRPGDRIFVTIFENVENGIFSTRGTPSTLEQITVPNTGTISLPYVGFVQVSGRTLEVVQQEIQNSLGEQTPDPQIILGRAGEATASVTVLGTVGSPGRVQLGPSTQSFVETIAASGGLVAEPQSTHARLERGGRSVSIPVGDVFSGALPDFFVAPGDTIILEVRQRSYTVFGHVSGTSVYAIETESPSLIEALSAAGGLSTRSGSASGIFVFRPRSDTPSNSSSNPDQGPGLPENTVYTIDLRSPDGVFLASQFTVADEDVIYVTQAPFSRFSLVISEIFRPINALQSVSP